jgi:hypothetical protein
LLSKGGTKIMLVPKTTKQAELRFRDFGDLDYPGAPMPVEDLSE